MNSNQVIYFENGFKKTVFHIVGTKEGEFFQLLLSDGRRILLNKDKINMIEIIPNELGEASWGKLFGTYCAQTQKWNKRSPKK